MLALPKQGDAVPGGMKFAIDRDMNIVARVIDVLIVFNVPMPDIRIQSSDDGAVVTLGRLHVGSSENRAIARRVAQMVGVRAVDTCVA